MGKYDVVIIGSGLGGLLCGYILSKNGFKVLILEKNHQFGGCLQTFSRSGVKFDTGMHYIGSMEPGQIMHRFFNYFSLHTNVKLHKLDINGYDVISVNGDKYKFAMGYEQFVDELSGNFPNERVQIQAYIDKIQKIAYESPLYNLQEIQHQVLLNIESVKTSVNDYIESLTKNKTLQAVLTGNIPLYAGKRDKTPLYIHALINNFYIQSAHRIVGGSDGIANSLVESVRNFGGEIVSNAKVVKINCEGNKAVSVELENGEIIEGNSFISNIHPQATVDKLDTHLVRKAYRERISNLENTTSNFTVYIKFKKDAVKYLNYNYYFYENADVWECNSYSAENWPLNYLFMHQTPVNMSDYADSALLITYMNYKDVQKWENSWVGKRGNDYIEFKKIKAEKALQSLEKSFPGIISKIETFYTSTPLTYRDYTATKEGSMYGVLRDKNFPTQTLVSQRTRIPNLFMTGQNINSHGIMGVTIGAIITCAEYLGVNNIIKEINQY